ncbi:hypothetical protein DXA63_05470 [Segatella copri]|uniref:Leucine rich repeat protein n=1 Tax=Segatella copri TaxID=165179 RepID=A0AA92WEN0_9BACT|nr:hypothetical protein DXA63_05470 [Segatella copri]
MYETINKIYLTISEKQTPKNSIGICFQSCFNLKSIQFPPSLRTIGNHAFQSCSNLESISLPGLTTIAESTFDVR